MGGCLRLGLLALLHLGSGYAGYFEQIKGKMGEKVGLPCCHELSSSESLQSYRIYWQKSTTEVVLAYVPEQGITTDERYENRTVLDTRNFTLWISPVEILDNGSYQCIVQVLSLARVLCEKHVAFFVTADFSTPNVTAEVVASSCESAEVMLTCSSHGGFPKPKVCGALDSKPVVWNASQVAKSSLSLYNVTAQLWLSLTQDASFTCSLEYNGFVTSTSLLLKKANDCVVLPKPPPYHVIAASSIVIVVFLLALALAARYLSRHVCSCSGTPQDSVEEGVKECTKPLTSSKMTSETSSV
ncbi:T-lymphocyte activation antigen CD80 isoform X2 [Pogoniulus pusillus]|uniref:T-lymphocyte activation antigen CD80 isoform X2 n=1 Tax=Pogoniulus pusillus TaxID=488313 RepID=UPI0030B95C62